VYDELEAILQQRSHHRSRLIHRRDDRRCGSHVEALGADPVWSSHDLEE
jgi:hypothetical protein